MVRIAGTDLPRAKRVEYALTKIYGIGVISSQEILAKANVDPNARTNDLTDENVSSIRQVIESEYKVEGDLRRETSLNIKRLSEIIVTVAVDIVKCYLYEDNVHVQMHVHVEVRRRQLLVRRNKV